MMSHLLRFGPVVAFAALSLTAMPTRRQQGKVTVTNSKQQRIELSVQGSPRYRWYLDETNHSAVRLPARYEYAYRGAEGDLVASGLLCGASEAAEHGLKQGITPSPEFLLRRRRLRDTPPRVIASPRPIQVRQPDGSTCELLLRGDEAYSWYVERATGYAVVHRPERYVYAYRGASGELVATDLEVGTVNASEHGLRTNITPSESVLRSPDDSAKHP